MKIGGDLKSIVNRIMEMMCKNNGNIFMFFFLVWYGLDVYLFYSIYFDLNFVYVPEAVGVAVMDILGFGFWFAWTFVFFVFLILSIFSYFILEVNKKLFNIEVVFFIFISFFDYFLYCKLERQILNVGSYY